MRTRQRTVAHLLIIFLGFTLTTLGFAGLLSSPPDYVAWRPSISFLTLVSGAATLHFLIYLLPWPRVVLSAVWAVFFAFSGHILPLLAVTFVSLSAVAIGNILLRGRQQLVVAATLGFALLGSLFSVLVLFPINSWVLWAMLLAAPLPFLAKLPWKGLFHWFTAGFKKSRRPVRELLILAFATPHILIALMPEIGHDALAFHLYVPTYVRDFGFWHAQPEIFIFSVGPMLTDWIYSLVFLFGGEISARIINTLAIFLSAAMISSTARLFDASIRSRGVAVLLFLSTPLVFLESSSLFADSWWTAFLLGGTLLLVKTIMWNGALAADIGAGILLGAALAAKAVSIPMIGVLLVAQYFLPQERKLSRNRVLGVGVPFALIGGSPYLFAFWKTGNPVFPFFNGIFQSNYNYPSNFESGFFPASLSMEIFFDWTFSSAKHIEGSAGAAGFHWLLLVVPAIISGFFTKNLPGKTWTLALAGTWTIAIFSQTAYLRYVLPAFGMFLVYLAIVLSSDWLKNRFVKATISANVLVALVLNLIHLDSATWYGSIRSSVIANSDSRANYISEILPSREAILLVNEENTQRTPVAFFGSTSVAYLNAKALHYGWYSPLFQQKITASQSPEEFRQVLAEHKVGFVVIQEALTDPEVQARLSAVSEEVGRFGDTVVRKVS